MASALFQNDDFTFGSKLSKQRSKIIQWEIKTKINKKIYLLRIRPEVMNEVAPVVATPLHIPSQQLRLYNRTNIQCFFSDELSKTDVISYFSFCMNIYITVLFSR